MKIRLTYCFHDIKNSKCYLFWATAIHCSTYTVLLHLKVISYSLLVAGSVHLICTINYDTASARTAFQY